MNDKSRHVPATGSEAAMASDVMRALLARLLISRKRPLVGTHAAGEAAAGFMLRVALDRKGTITAWLEDPEPEMRHGVAYVADPLAQRGTRNG